MTRPVRPGVAASLILPPPLRRLWCNGLHRATKYLLIGCKCLHVGAWLKWLGCGASDRFGRNSGAGSWRFRGQLVILLLALTIPAAASARIVPFERAYPFGQTSYEYPSGIPLSGLTSNLVRPYPWARVTIAYNTANGNVLEGCSGNGVATVRVWTWTHGAGWDLTTCIGREPWRIVLRGIGPAVHVEAIVTFR